MKTRYQMIWENYLLDNGHPQNHHEATWEAYYAQNGHPSLRAEWEEFYAKRGLDLYGRPLKR